MPKLSISKPKKAKKNQTLDEMFAGFDLLVRAMRRSLTEIEEEMKRLKKLKGGKEWDS